jgi:heme exporter protein C
MNRFEKAAIGAVALMLLAAGAIFLYAPADHLQGAVQRVFYLHVSSAITAFACFSVVLVGGIVYLRNESPAADRLARAGALVGVVFTTVTLVMGMLWAKPVWGAYWVWDARLTSTLVLWIIYSGYLLVRRLAEPGRQAARFASVVGIFGFVDVPVVYFSVSWWNTHHPGPLIINDALPPQMLATFLFTMLCTLVLGGVMIGIRYRIETLLDARRGMTQRAHVVAARRADASPEPAP